MEQEQKEVQRDITIMYHRHCNDGTAAAIMAFSLVHKEADLEKVEGLMHIDHLAVNYNEGLPDESTYKGKHVYVVDFSFTGADLETLVEAAERVTIIDHHEFAVKDILAKEFPDEDTYNKVFERYQKGIARCKLREGKLRLVLGKKYSGAMLVSIELNPDKIPEIVKYVSDRDLWNFEYGDATKHVHQGLSLLGKQGVFVGDNFSFDMNDARTVMKLGKPLHDAYIGYCKESSHSNHTLVLNGHECIMFNTIGSLASDSCDQRKKDFPLQVAYHIGENADVKLSFRCRTGLGIAGPIARSLGGGGHPDAAGANISIDRLKTILLSNSYNTLKSEYVHKSFTLNQVRNALSEDLTPINTVVIEGKEFKVLPIDTVTRSILNTEGILVIASNHVLRITNRLGTKLIPQLKAVQFTPEEDIVGLAYEALLLLPLTEEQ